MTHAFVKLVGLSLIAGLAATSGARADCESDLIQLEQAFKAPNLSVDAKAALDVAKTKSVAAMRKDDDATCHAAVTEGLTRARIVALPAAAPAASGPTKPLGDLSTYRVIAQDTLGIVKKGDLAAATIRIKDLETVWDAAEPKLKPLNKDQWTTIDKAIDVALKQLRAGTPVAASSEDALQKLVAVIDAAK